MNQLDMRGRTAVITGGASGIGLAIARRMAASAAQLSLWDTREEALAEAAGALGGAHTAVVDVRDYAAVEAARDATLFALGRIDALVNSAGITGPNVLTWEYPLDGWRDVLDVNLTGTFHACRAVVAPMLAAEYGRIVNIASVAGKEGNPNASAYSASKAGVIALTKSLGNARRGRNADVRADDAGAHRLHEVEDPDEPLRHARRDRRARHVAVHRRLLVLDRRGFRSLRRPLDLLVGRRADSDAEHGLLGSDDRSALDTLDFMFYLN